MKYVVKRLRWTQFLSRKEEKPDNDTEGLLPNVEDFNGVEDFNDVEAQWPSASVSVCVCFRNYCLFILTATRKVLILYLYLILNLLHEIY
jgi:hypothetical protein